MVYVGVVAYLYKHDLIGVNFKIYLCVYMCVCVSACQICAGTCRGQESVLDPMQLESSVIVAGY